MGKTIADTKPKSNGKGRPDFDGIPENYSNEIVAWISNGKTLREYARQEGKPSWQIIYEWLNKDEDFSRRFARARELGADAIAQECFDIADNANNDWIDRQGKDGATTQQFNSEHVQRSKLRIETRLKLLAKWNPKLYGEKLDVTTEGKAFSPAQIIIQQITTKAGLKADK
jgi:hypothetical protein